MSPHIFPIIPKNPITVRNIRNRHRSVKNPALSGISGDKDIPLAVAHAPVKLLHTQTPSIAHKMQVVCADKGYK